MAKFCKYCGKSLEDGEICNCTVVSNAEPQPSQQEDHSTTSTPVQKQNIFSDIISVLKNPITAGNKILNSNNMITTSFLFSLITTLSYLLIFICLGVKMHYNGFITIIGGGLLSTVLSIIVDSLIASAYFISSKIIKGELSYRVAFGITSISNAPKIATNILLALGSLFFDIKSFNSLNYFMNYSLILVIIIITGIVSANVFRSCLLVDKMNIVDTKRIYMPIISTSLAYLFLFAIVEIIIVIFAEIFA